MARTIEETSDVMLHNGLIRVQPNWMDCTSIESRAWLDEIFNCKEKNTTDNKYSEWLETQEPDNERYWVQEHEEQIQNWLFEKTGKNYDCTSATNTYNTEQDFYNQMVYSFFYPENSSDWIYADDVYLAVQFHCGGDVRGNYSRTHLYGPVDCPAEVGLLDWNIGWYVTFRDGENADENGEYDIGYSNCPTYHLTDHLVDKATKWNSEKQCFVSRHKPTGRTVFCYPQIRVY